MQVLYSTGFNAWEEFQKNVRRIIIENKFTRIAEIGGGANPLLSIEFVKENKIVYHVIDISVDEVLKADKGYEIKIINLEEQSLELKEEYDFVFSQMTLEHIKNPEPFHKNIFKILKPGGMAFFFFACITNLPMLINFLIPESVSKKILLTLQPFRDNEKHGKFKAYYKWCFGPTKKNISRFQKLNFDVKTYTGYFGHSYYYRISFLNSLEKVKTKYLLKHPNPYFCTYSHVLLQKNNL